MHDRVYLDWNATTPLRREAREAMAAAWDLGGNPSSVHAEGRGRARLVEDARAVIAEAVGADARNVVFTSGGTEANALALTPGMRRDSGFRSKVAGFGHRTCLGAGGRPVFARMRSSAVGVTSPALWISTACARCCSRTARVGVGHARPTTKPAPFSRSRKWPISSMAQADCCMSMRFRHLEKYLLISIR